MNEHVLTITTSARSASGITCIPAPCRWPTIISLSTRFLAQPSEIRLTLIMPGIPGDSKVLARNGLLLLGGGRSDLLALKVGGAAFAFDDLV